MTSEAAPDPQTMENLQRRVRNLETMIYGTDGDDTNFAKGLWFRIIHLEVSSRDYEMPELQSTTAKVTNAEDEIESLKFELDLLREYLGVDRVKFLELWGQIRDAQAERQQEDLGEQ